MAEGSCVVPMPKKAVNGCCIKKILKMFAGGLELPSLVGQPWRETRKNPATRPGRGLKFRCLSC